MYGTATIYMYVFRSKYASRSWKVSNCLLTEFKILICIYCTVPTNLPIVLAVFFPSYSVTPQSTNISRTSDNFSCSQTAYTYFINFISSTLAQLYIQYLIIWNKSRPFYLFLWAIEYINRIFSNPTVWGKWASKCNRLIPANTVCSHNTNLINECRVIFQ